jgi:dihydroorotate dehydrogenase
VTTVEKGELGGLSGPPLKPLSLRTLSLLRSLLPSSILIIGCGGISSGAEALEYTCAGASAVQLYTAFGYGGIGTAQRIKDEIAEELKRQGTMWADVSWEVTQCLAWKAPTCAVTEGDNEDDTAVLICEVEELKGLLDGVAARFLESA